MGEAEPVGCVFKILVRVSLRDRDPPASCRGSRRIGPRAFSRGRQDRLCCNGQIPASMAAQERELPNHIAQGA